MTRGILNTGSPWPNTAEHWMTLINQSAFNAQTHSRVITSNEMIYMTAGFNNPMQHDLKEELLLLND